MFHNLECSFSLAMFVRWVDEWLGKESILGITHRPEALTLAPWVHAMTLSPTSPSCVGATYDRTSRKALASRVGVERSVFRCSTPQRPVPFSVVLAPWRVGCTVRSAFMGSEEPWSCTTPPPGSSALRGGVGPLRGARLLRRMRAAEYGTLPLVRRVPCARARAMRTPCATAVPPGTPHACHSRGGSGEEVGSKFAARGKRSAHSSRRASEGFVRDSVVDTDDRCFGNLIARRYPPELVSGVAAGQDFVYELT